MRLQGSFVRSALLCAMVGCAFASDAVEVQVMLERRDGPQWTAVDPHLVLRGGDEVRFKFRSNRAGFLYVVNHDASGHDTWLFPTHEAGEQNSIDPDKTYVIPAGNGVFEIANRPGYERTYWILSPMELRANLNMGSESNADVEKLNRTPLLPRCDDGPLIARGPCNDRQAGAHRMPQANSRNWFEGAALQPRDVTVDEHNQRSRISMTAEAGAPLIYEYRIAHR